MSDGEYVVINHRVRIPMSELFFSATQSGGPGGQHVNKTATRIELRFDLENTTSLNESDKARIREKLKNKINAAGEIIVFSDRYRSQKRNREDAIEKFRQLLAQALRVPKRRGKTKPTKSSTQKRLDQKKRRSNIKRTRRDRDY